MVPAMPHPLVVEQVIDDRWLANAERDLARMLIVQNARIATRWDPFSKQRTHQNEHRIRRFGLLLTIVGGVLALVLVAGGALTSGSIEPLHIGLLLTMVLLLVTFLYLPQLRTRLMRGVDGMLKRRAQRLLSRVTPPLRLRYTLESNTLRCDTIQDDTAHPRFQRPLPALRYALIGEGVIALFKRPRAQNPAAILLTHDTPFAQALSAAGILTEPLSKSLLPTTTIERHW
jgi:hypothetical protein